MQLLDQDIFDRISTLAMARWGLHLTEKKLPLVSNRLASFLRKSPFKTVEEYVTHLEADATDEDMLLFFDVLSTNVTSFFRDKPHFDYLERELFTPLSRGNVTFPGKRIRLWSAGCSTGPEPYSMAIWALEHLRNLDSWDFKILATDLSNYAVSEAQAGIYPRKMLEGMDRAMVQSHFERVDDATVCVAPHVRKLVTVARMNLMEPWPVKGPFNVIFCRNVMIYFDNPTREKLVNRYYDILHPGGVLAVGSAETLTGLETRFKSAQASLYVK